MFKQIIPLSKVSGWAITSGSANAAHTVVCEIQPGARFHNILISGGAGVSKKMTDLIGDIRVIANDEVVRLHSATELNAKLALMGPQYCAYKGNSGHATAANNVFDLPIMFAEPWRKDSLAGEKLAWNTRGLRNFRVECDIKADTFTTPTQLAFTAEIDYAPLDADAPGVMGLIKKTDRTTINTAADWNDIMTFPRSGIYQEINFVSTAITEIEVKRGNSTEIGPLLLQKLQSRQIHADMFPVFPAFAAAAAAPDIPVGVDDGTALPYGGTVHAASRGMTDIVFDGNDRLISGLVSDPSRDFNVRIKITTGANIVALYDRLAPL